MMSNKKDTDYFLSKVPALKNPISAIATFLYIALLFLMAMIFFYFMDKLIWFAPLINQLIMVIVTVVIGYLHIKTSNAYRKKYKELAYQYHFYHIMIPYLVAWYACFFHPLFIKGEALMPYWISIPLGILCIVITVLTNIHIERAGFKNITHGMDIFSIYPEETSAVHGEIYSYIRHPLYFSLIVGALGLSLFMNNWMSVSVALFIILPSLIIGRIEDNELLKRYGNQHKQYIKNTAMLFPIRKLIQYFRLLLFISYKKQ